MSYAHAAFLRETVRNIAILTLIQDNSIGSGVGLQGSLLAALVSECKGDRASYEPAVHTW